jgi:hypothetical protein
VAVLIFAIVGPACGLDYRPAVLIMVACARSAARAWRGGYPRGAGRPGRGTGAAPGPGLRDVVEIVVCAPVTCGP